MGALNAIHLSYFIVISLPLYVCLLHCFLARDVYTSRAYATMSVSVCDGSALWSQSAMDPGYLCMFG